MSDPIFEKPQPSLIPTNRYDPSDNVMPCLKAGVRVTRGIANAGENAVLYTGLVAVVTRVNPAAGARLAQVLLTQGVREFVHNPPRRNIDKVQLGATLVFGAGMARAAGGGPKPTRPTAEPTQRVGITQQEGPSEPPKPAQEPVQEPTPAPKSIDELSGPLKPGEGREMLGEAKARLKAARPEDRVALFAKLKTDIEQNATGDWSAKQEPLTDGGTAFIGSKGPVLVIDPKGDMFFGMMTGGKPLFDFGPEMTLTPIYGNMKPW